MAITYNKPVQSSVISRSEANTTQTINGSSLLFTLADRTILTSKEANYFTSFNLPAKSTLFPTTSPLSLTNPELQQLNVDKIIVCPIPASSYNEIIDGRSITFTVPQISGTTSISAKTIVSSTYIDLIKQSESTMLGYNIAYLFSDDINKPYTGTVRSVSKSANTTWNPATGYIYRPAAVSYGQLDTTTPNLTDINSDNRGSINYAVSVSSGYPNGLATGYNYDIPVGIVALDKGVIILTHPSIVNNIPWNLGQQAVTATVNTGPTSATTNIYFSATSTSTLSFVETSTRFKQSVICLALPGEFYWSENPTFDKAFAYSEQINGSDGYRPLYVSEIGLYNKLGELIAIAKLDRPTEKSYTNIITFNLDIDV